MSLQALQALVVLASGLLGAVFGSFATVVAYRVPRGESIVRPRSRCPACGVAIKSRDNIPVLSWLVRRGRCRACGAGISIRYPFTELSSAALFVAACVRFGAEPYIAIMLAMFFWVLLVVSLIDVEHQKIPNKITYPAVLVATVAIALGWALGVPLLPVSAVIGGLAFGGVLFMISMAYPAGMGMGDAKLSGLIGLVLGSLGAPYVPVAAGAAVILGGLVGIVLLVVNGGQSKHLPFGPALAVGAAISAMFAPQIWGWYQGMFTSI